MIVDTAPINVDPVSATKEVISTTMNSDDRRKREAADALVLDVVRGSDESVISSLRIALEVQQHNYFIITQILIHYW